MLDNTLTLLKLKYSGYTTKQLKKLFEFEPQFLSLSETLKVKQLQQFSLLNSSKSYENKYQQYLDIDLPSIIKSLQTSNIHVISIFDSHYPILLKQIYDPPYLLFCKGNLKLLENPIFLSVVGSREASAYTQHALHFLFCDMIDTHLVIVSGLAKGGDSFAHEAALKFNLPTIGVLAFGHQYHYPKETRMLREEMEQHNLTISEYTPETKPQRYQFPERNRLISGLSQGLLITESRERSGAQITVDLALQQNRNVYVLPGSLFQSLTIGNLKRAQEGAKIVLSATDILEDYFLEDLF